MPVSAVEFSRTRTRNSAISEVEAKRSFQNVVFLKKMLIHSRKVKLSRLVGSSVMHQGYFSDGIPSANHSGDLGEVRTVAS